LAQFIGKLMGRGWRGWIALALAAAAMAATWVYGFSKGTDVGLVCLPLGVLVFFCTLGALAVPLLTAVLVVVAFLTRIDQGAAPAGVLAAETFLAVGLLNLAWTVGRERRRG
jgi:hypothetical protein